MRLYLLIIPLLLLPIRGIAGDARPATPPRDVLFRLVPANTTFCFVVQDLRGATSKQDDKSFAVNISKLPFLQKAIQSPDMIKFQQMQQQILKELDIKEEQLRDEIFGDAIVFAFRQGDAQNPAVQDEGVFLLWARDKALLLRTIDRLNAIQTKSGEVKELNEHRYKERVYRQRVKAKDKGGDEYYFLEGNVLAFTAQKHLIESVIDSDLSAATVAQKAPLWTTLADQLHLETSLMSWIVNPRTFDAEIKNRIDKADGLEKAFLQEFTTYWKATDSLAISTRLDRDFDLSFSFRMHLDRIPKSAQRFFREVGKPSELWASMPENALLAIGSRLDFVALAELFGGFCDMDTRKAIRGNLTSATEKFLGRGNLDTLALGVGPDWGFWIVPPQLEPKTWVPQSCLALKLQGTDSGKKAEALIFAALEKLLVLAEFTPGVTVEKNKQGMVEVRTIRFAPERQVPFQPSFAVKGGYLVLATAPVLIEQFDPTVPRRNPSGTETPFLRLSAKNCESYLRTYRTQIAESIARNHQLKADQVLPQLDMILDNLQFFESLELFVQSRTDQATITLRLRNRLAK